MTLILQKNGFLIFWWKEPDRHACQYIRLIRRSSTHFLICDIHWCFSVEVAAYTTKDLLGLISFQPFRKAEIKRRLRLIQIIRQVTDGQLPSGSTYNITCISLTIITNFITLIIFHRQISFCHFTFNYLSFSIFKVNLVKYKTKTKI